MTEKTTIIVPDMTCQHCVGTIRSALEEALPGSRIEIDLETKQVTFTGDQSIGTDAVREAGYTPKIND